MYITVADHSKGLSPSSTSGFPYVLRFKYRTILTSLMVRRCSCVKQGILLASYVVPSKNDMKEANIILYRLGAVMV